MQQLVSWLRQGSLSCNDQRCCEIALRSIQLLSHCSDNSLNVLQVLSILLLPGNTKINQFSTSFFAFSHSIHLFICDKKRPHHLDACIACAIVHECMINALRSPDFYVFKWNFLRVLISYPRGEHRGEPGEVGASIMGFHGIWSLRNY